MRVPGLKSLRRTASWLYSRVADFVLILGYHRVAQTTCDPLELCVSPDNFAEQLDVLRRRTDVIDLNSLERGFRSGKLPRRTVAITFDDGYQDILQTARPLLAKRDMPCTVFAVTGALGQEFWWDSLSRIIYTPATLPEKLTIKIGTDTLAWTDVGATQVKGYTGESNRRRLLDLLYPRLAALPDERSPILAHLLQWAETTGQVSAAVSCAMTAEELQALSYDGLTTVGSHTVSHPALTTLARAQQLTELTQSRQTLEEILGKPVTFFSYPHGDNDAGTRRLVGHAGYHLACSSRPGIVHKRQNHFALPRFWVPDWSGEQFEHWLSTWIHN